MQTAIHPNPQAESKAATGLRPRIHPVIQNFLAQPELLHSLCAGFGSPLNVMFPENIDDNIRSFEAAYKKNHMRGRIYFTSKLKVIFILKIRSFVWYQIFRDSLRFF